MRPEIPVFMLSKELSMNGGARYILLVSDARTGAGVATTSYSAHTDRDMAATLSGVFISICHLTSGLSRVTSNKNEVLP